MWLTKIFSKQGFIHLALDKSGVDGDCSVAWRLLQFGEFGSVIENNGSSFGRSMSMLENGLKRPTIGLALGAGMARGCAHVGVLREFGTQGGGARGVFSGVDMGPVRCPGGGSWNSQRRRAGVT